VNTRATDLVPAVAAILTLLVVFNIFYSIVPSPITIVSIDEVLHFAPKAYVHPYEQPDEIVATEKSWRGYKVIEYWYKWSYDGPEARDDWEPVILLIDGDHVKAVISRIHYSWRISYTFPMDGDRPIVTFLYGYHTPALRPPLSDWVEVTTPITLGSPPESVNYDEVFGWSILPTESALASAMVLSILAASVIYILVRELLVWVSLRFT